MVSKDSVDRLLTGLMASCALVMTVFFVRRELQKPPDPNAPVQVEDWEKYAVGNMRMGPPGAPVVLVEFSDFQCPYCAQLTNALAELRIKYPSDLQVVFRNFPIEQLHPFAPAAARAAQCAANVGHFEALHNYLFANVDSIGAEPWASIAIKSGIADTLGYLACMDSPATETKVMEDSLAAAEAGIGGTPMVMVNGLLFGGSPPKATLDSLIRSIIEDE